MARISENPPKKSVSNDKRTTIEVAKERGQADLIPPKQAEESISVMPYVSMAMGVAGGLYSGLEAFQGLQMYANELIQAVNEGNSTSYARCQGEKEYLNDYDIKSPSDILGAIDFEWDCTGCAPTTLGKYIDEAKKSDPPQEDPGATWSLVMNAIADLSQPADIAGCVNPYWQKFFGLIPYQMLLSYYLKKILAAFLDGRTELMEELEEKLKETPCGTEVIKTLKTSEQIQEFDVIDLDLLKLPPLPTFKIPNLMQILKKLIVDYTCYAMCCTLTPLIKKLSEAMMQLSDRLMEEQGAALDMESTLDSSEIKKINLKNWVHDAAIIAAIDEEALGYSEVITTYDKNVAKEIGVGYNRVLSEILGPKPDHITSFAYQEGLWRKPTAAEEKKAKKKIIDLVKGPDGLFDSIYNFSQSYKKKTYIPKSKPPEYELKDASRDLGTKELLYLMMGETNCQILADALSVSTQNSAFINYLNLSDEDKILAFFQSLLNFVNPFTVIEKTKPKDCPVDPCVKIDDDLKEEIFSVLNNMCDVLSPAMGMVPVPLNLIMSQTGLAAMFNDGVKAQFTLLKSKYYDFLGNPPYCGCTGETKTGPVYKTPPPAPNQFYFEMHNSIYNRLKPIIGSNGDKIVSDNQFETIYGNFITHILFRGLSPGKHDDEQGCDDLWPEDHLYVPAWPYDNIDFEADGTLADLCLDENFTETFNNIFKKGFKVKKDYVESVGEYTKEVEKTLVPITEKIAEDRTKRVAGVAITGNPCCKYKGWNWGKGKGDVAVLGPGDVVPPIWSKFYDLKESYTDQWDGDYEDEVVAVFQGMTLEEKCYVCRRGKDVGGNSMLDYIEGRMKLDDPKEMGQIYDALNCPQFGYPGKNGSAGGAASAGSHVAMMNKCDPVSAWPHKEKDDKGKKDAEAVQPKP